MESWSRVRMGGKLMLRWQPDERSARSCPKRKWYLRRQLSAIPPCVLVTLCIMPTRIQSLHP